MVLTHTERRKVQAGDQVTILRVALEELANVLQVRVCQNRPADVAWLARRLQTARKALLCVT
jgi:hypothetical protein